MNIIIYIMEGKSLDAKRELFGNKGEIGKDYVQKHQIPFRNTTGW